jgi:hypothetical protein
MQPLRSGLPGNRPGASAQVIVSLVLSGFSTLLSSFDTYYRQMWTTHIPKMFDSSEPAHAALLVHATSAPATPGEAELA